jgi:hypothetical protein
MGRYIGLVLVFWFFLDLAGILLEEVVSKALST